MKNFITGLATLCLVSLMTINSIAVTASEYNSDPITTSQQLLKYLQLIDISDLEEEKTVVVLFIINANNEILVLSTNDDEYDYRIKTGLNYKKLENCELSINTPYWIPIAFKRE